MWQVTRLTTAKEFLAAKTVRVVAAMAVATCRNVFQRVATRSVVLRTRVPRARMLPLWTARSAGK